MKPMLNPIIFIGFKHVGKTVIGRELARQLNVPFIDLDEEIERIFDHENKKKMTCRQIMNEYGQSYFRNLEKRSLKHIAQSPPSVIALGGGTPLDIENQGLIKHGTVIHLEAPPDVVFERIMLHGRPAFFVAEESPRDSFNRLWHERDEIYKKLAHFSIENNGLIDSVVERILKNLRIKSEMGSS